MNLLRAIDDPRLFGPWFKDEETWRAWLAFITALFAHSLDKDQASIFRQCTGRAELHTEPFREAWLVIGRRGGKSFVMALLAVFLACFRDYRIYLAPGERATVLVIAADRKQSRVILRYARALLTGMPMLQQMIERETAESFDLTNSVTIEVATASFRTVRGYTLCAALCDELAFWRSDDAASPDYAVLDALRPAMATIPTSMLLCASSPYSRRGALWDAYQRYFGKDDARVLVWQAPTRVMNPTVPQSVIDEAYEKDASSAAAEYGAEFRNDLEDFISRAAVTACIEPGVRERPPARMFRYVGFVDPSGGVSDSFTLGIAHQAGERGTETAVLDVLREVRPPLSPEAVVSEFAGLLKTYRVTKVRGDRYGAEWVREQFRKHGVDYEPSEKSRSEIYLNLLPAINSRAVDLLDNDRMVSQLTTLARRRGPGRDSIDHPRGSHDALANAAAGAIVHARTMPATTRLAGLRKRHPGFSDPLAMWR